MQVSGQIYDTAALPSGKEYPLLKVVGVPQSRGGRFPSENLQSSIVLISGDSPMDQQGMSCWKHETSCRNVIIFRLTLFGGDCAIWRLPAADVEL